MARCLIALGSNLGDRAATIQSALDRLGAADLRVIARSREHSTSPIGGAADQPEFLNAAAVIDTLRSPRELIAELLEIERQLGRVRQQRWSARTIDLDLLLYEEQIISEPDLIVPHPRLAFRRFVLAPAVEIAADWKHPQIGWTLGQLLDHVDRAANYAALCDTPSGDAIALCDAVAEKTDCHPLHLDRQLQSSDQQQVVSIRIAKAITLLHQTALPAPHERWLVSDFWLNDGLVMARAAGAGSTEFRHLESLIESTKLTSVASVNPKLLVVFQTSDSNSAYQSALDEILQMRYEGPVLRILPHNEAQATLEVAAAMLGMTNLPPHEF